MTNMDDIRGTWVSIADLNGCVLLFKSLIVRPPTENCLTHLELSSFLQVFTDTFAANHVRSLQFLIGKERSLVRQESFLITRR